MPVSEFIPRAVKASWGFPCNQKADGSLWAGKGYECPLEDQFEEDMVSDIRNAIQRTRGSRNGRFWINLKSRVVTMAVGESSDNEYDSAVF
jgi:hypothetical protein